MYITTMSPRLPHSRREQPWYDTALICLNGHLINPAARLHPQHNRDFCTQCGAKTIQRCPSCSADILGEYHYPNVVSLEPFPVPSYCHKCGARYPWMETKIQDARRRIKELKSLSDEDKDVLLMILDDLIRQTPETELAVERFKNLLRGIRPDVRVLIKEILSGVATDLAKKTLEKLFGL
jgi:hypothetical protein